MKTLKLAFSQFVRGTWSLVIARFWPFLNANNVYGDNGSNQDARYRPEELSELARFLKRATEKPDFSFAAEYERIIYWMKKLSVPCNFVVDIGASDGFTQSCTFPFSWRNQVPGLLLEADPKKLSYLAALYRDHANSQIVQARVTPSNVGEILSAHEVPRNVSFLNIDIDSFDLSVLRGLLNSGFRPDVISMEVNEKIPGSVLFEVLYTADHSWDGSHFYGCSLASAHLTLSSYGYALVELVWNNAIFVRRELVVQDLELSSGDAHRDGYAARPERDRLFPWNQDVNYWLDLPPMEAVWAINSYFRAYQGRFSIGVDNLS